MSKRFSIDYVRDYLNNLDILLLDNNYINNETKLHLKCNKDHEYYADLTHIKRGHRCPICAGNLRHTINYVRDYCNNEGLELLSTEYLNNSQLLELKCSFGHIFYLEFSRIRRGRSCCFCNGKPTIDKFKQIAINKNAICLTKEYISAKSKLSIHCNRCNKIFQITPNNMNNGKWCPNCSMSTSERLCRLALEEIFSQPFPTIRPIWLRNITNYPLQLDGYNGSDIAFEHQGSYHYKIIEKYKMTEKHLLDVQKRDELKNKLCKDNNVKLIIIPELFKKVKLENLKDYIKIECERLNIDLPKNFDSIQIDYNKIYNDCE